MAKKTNPIATKALVKLKSEVIDAEATVIKRKQKKKRPAIAGWASMKKNYGTIWSSKYTIQLLVDMKTEAELGYIVSTYGSNHPNNIFPSRPTKKPYQIFLLPLDFDFSFFGDSIEFSGACGGFDIDDLPKGFKLPEYMQVEAVKAEFEVIKSKLKAMSRSKFEGPRTAAIQALELFESLEKKMSEEVKPIAIPN